ncbi:hypothetical protein AAE478_006813 [Parahypoxylon ruwenzoriense]
MPKLQREPKRGFRELALAVGGALVAKLHLEALALAVGVPRETLLYSKILGDEYPQPGALGQVSELRTHSQRYGEDTKLYLFSEAGERLKLDLALTAVI